MSKTIISLVATLLGLISPELLKEVADKILDIIEDAVADSENKTDDILVLPLCKLARDAFGIEDNDE